MAIVQNSFTSFSAVGNREDLSDTIYNISPVDTPFLAAIGKSKATAVLHEWQTDALAPVAANAQLEGDDVLGGNNMASAVTPTARLSNRCQISRKDVVVSGTQDVVQKAGRSSEIVYQMLKRAKELKRDIEFTLTNNQVPNSGSDSVARKLRPLCGWYSTNSYRGSGGSNGTVSAAATDNGTLRSLTESMVKTALQACWTAGGNPDLIMSGPFNKTVISGFTGNNTRFQDTSDGKLSAAIDIYESDFGIHKVAANRFSRDRDLHILTTEMWAIAYLRPMQTLDLAKTGDNEKGQIIAEYTLESRNEAASAIIADLVNSAGAA
ncbi:MAG: DUF5309 domain-containing protein [Candidatus Pacebacteria bacterium]|nr:DUF5309 domain-containing protein [Candidatus Paceibacterota bacterium]